MINKFDYYLLVTVVNVSSKLISQLVGLVGRVFANGTGDWGSIQGCIIPKPLKNGT